MARSRRDQALTDSAGVDTRLAEPIPAPETGPPVKAVSARQWVQDNLFNSAFNAVVTVVFAILLGWVAYKAVTFVFVTGRWEIVEGNLTNFMVGRFPRDELFRPWIAIFVAAAVAGVAGGFTARRGPTDSWRSNLQRALPAIALVVILLAFTRSVLPAALTAVTVAVFLAFRWLGARLPARASRGLPLLYLLGVVGVFMAIVGFGGVHWDAWGGLLLTLNLAIAGIVLSFPIGVLLALGRRSTFPAVRVVCVGYIELIRGVPLITLLFMGSFALGFFLPAGMDRPGRVTRAIVALVLFTAAYVAEIVRGGLQGVPKGQTEAAQALGLSPVRTTALIVLPQGLRNVIPALVGQFISLFKDTSLVVIIGLLDLLAVAQVVPTQPDFIGQGLEAETLVFVSFVFWSFCYAMSRASQRLEKRLGVGER